MKNLLKPLHFAARLRWMLHEAAGARERITQLEGERDRLRETVRTIEAAHMAAPQMVPPGHFYSPVPTLAEVERLRPHLYDGEALTPAGVELRGAEQLALLRSFKRYYDEVTFPAQRAPGTRYFYENSAYSYSDAFYLHAMIRHVRPQRVIEAGSGYSSCQTLDVNERFFDGSIRCTFIEPYPKLLRELVSEQDVQRSEILAVGLQEVPLECFRELRANDILFVDSTHVVRVGSDVNYLFFSVLPALAEGVYVHIHDVFYPFEYPMHWFLEGRQWSELYLLRAFLMYNATFEVVLMNTFLEHHHPELMREQFPLCAAHPGGSIWLRKRTDPASVPA
jgi:hypothetical protein